MPGVEAFDAAIDRRSDYYRLQALSHVHDNPPPVGERQSLVVRAGLGCSAACGGETLGWGPHDFPD